eukprot:CAMPEP_0170967210 /NCGR_PEP_ID=MMETSP0735-20130129/42364_1 /TAXON_ID=186038 /ORGANISM="Fragilariopsis kerguelensis, Strain L26-C5" /LENGTH=36 /DNA_ID= /DNA_START= /DNA_END= /DNA_ORIENTATION=
MTRHPHMAQILPLKEAHENRMYDKYMLILSWCNYIL